MKTRTGGFPIGFRRGRTNWQRDTDELIAWTVENALSVIDLTGDVEADIAPVINAGLRVGSIDLPDGKAMMAADDGRRAEAIARNVERIRTCAKHGPMNIFVAMVPENPELPRAENFGYMVESYGELASVMEENQARLVIEGWPGPGALCCTPEGYRAFFDQVDSDAVGVNYDPSHLIRMGIDPLRFLQEFKARVYHTHGKDTEIIGENLYEYGSEQPATFAEKIHFGGHHWRYTIPGHGLTRWTEVFRILQENGYAGCVSIELEDANFWEDAEAQQLGILQGARFLSGC